MADRVMRRCAACEGEDPESGPARRRSIGNPGGPAEAPPIVYEVLRSAGEPLDASARTFLEPRFGYDFSQVRVHTDARAEASARAVNAHAYTVGRDVVMPSHAYQPGTSSGRQLLAHELSHVVQQSSEAGPGTARTLQRQASSGTSTGTSTEEDLPQPRLTLQVPFGFATFQAPLGGSNGVSSILRAPSATNTPFDTLYQPNLATVLNWSLHSGERGFELGLGLQGAGLFGGAGAGGQLAGYLQPTWVFLTWGAQNQHQLQVYLQPSVAEAFSSNRTVAGTSVSVPLGVQWAWTLRESERSQWQLFAGVSGGYQHTDLGNAPAGTPNPQDAGFIGVTIGFQFNRSLFALPARAAFPAGERGATSSALGAATATDTAATDPAKPSRSNPTSADSCAHTAAGAEPGCQHAHIARNLLPLRPAASEYGRGPIGAGLRRAGRRHSTAAGASGQSPSPRAAHRGGFRRGRCGLQSRSRTETRRMGRAAASRSAIVPTRPRAIYAPNASATGRGSSAAALPGPSSSPRTRTTGGCSRVSLPRNQLLAQRVMQLDQPCEPLG